jgi:hypothetical protein
MTDNLLTHAEIQYLANTFRTRHTVPADDVAYLRGQVTVTGTYDELERIANTLEAADGLTGEGARDQLRDRIENAIYSALEDSDDDFAPAVSHLLDGFDPEERDDFLRRVVNVLLAPKVEKEAEPKSQLAMYRGGAVTGRWSAKDFGVEKDVRQPDEQATPHLVEVDAGEMNVSPEVKALMAAFPGRVKFYKVGAPRSGILMDEDIKKFIDGL